MQPSIRAQSAPALTGYPADVAGSGADPWDAPYFGAPVYFAYHTGVAAGSSATVASTGAPAQRDLAGWTRFPYLGGPIYDGFPPFAPTEHYGSGALAATGPALDTLRPPLFGAPVYLAYEPGIPAFARDPAPPVPQAAQLRAPAIADEANEVIERARRRGGWLARLLGRG